MSKARDKGPTAQKFNREGERTVVSLISNDRLSCAELNTDDRSCTISTIPLLVNLSSSKMPSSKVRFFALSLSRSLAIADPSSFPPPFTDFQNAKLFSTKALDPSKPSTGGPATNIPDYVGDSKHGHGHSQAQPGNAPVTNEASNPSIEHITPAPIEPTNILLQPFPPPIDDSITHITSPLQLYAYSIVGALAVVWFFVAFGSGYMAFVWRSSIIGSIAAGVYVSHGIVERKIEKELKRIRLQQIQHRGEKVS